MKQSAGDFTGVDCRGSEKREEERCEHRSPWIWSLVDVGETQDPKTVPPQREF
jgi:hypothetical protein